MRGAPHILLVRLILLFCFVLAIGVVLHDHAVGPVTVADLADGGPQPIPYRGVNRLTMAASPYLRSAAAQSIWWNAWGPEPFLLARTLNRLVFLHIGASWCHWCRVMDRETFTHPEVAQFLNEQFIAVKLDRDERPDIDRRYQIAVGSLTGQGGVPLTVVLAPTGDVYYGGTIYFPWAVGRQEGLLTLLPAVTERYRLDRAAFASAVAFPREQLRIHFAPDLPAERLELAVGKAVAQGAATAFDHEAGGFGTQGPKFPEPGFWQFLLRWAFYDPAPQWRTMLATTLTRMATGGIADQLGGGFHRFAADRWWQAPRFEKFLSTNAALLELYTEAYVALKDPLYRDTAEGIGDYLLTTLRDPILGLFRDSQAAEDPAGEEDHYYTWRSAEVMTLLPPEERQVMALAFALRELPRDLPTVPERNVLKRAATTEAIARRLGWSVDRVAATFARARTRLLAERDKRPAPVVTPAAFGSSNGIAITALLRGGQIFHKPEWQTASLEALRAFWDGAWDPQRGFRRAWMNGGWHGEGLLADHAWLFVALVTAYEVTGDVDYLHRAESVAALIERRFADPSGGGFCDRAKAGSRTVPVGLEGDTFKPYYDHEEPAENPILAMAYDRLAALTDNPDWRTTAEGILLAIAGAHPGSLGRGLASYAMAVLTHLKPPAQVVIVGASDDVARALIAVVRQHGRPDTIVRLLPPGAPLPPGAASMQAELESLRQEGQTVALVCVASACAPPTADPTELDRQLASFGK